MCLANPLWGAPRVHGELLKLGLDVSVTTVSKYMVKHRGPPSQTWQTFLRNHAKELIALDFFTAPTATFRVLFVLVILSHDRRRILHFNVTEHPTAAWTARQLLDACGTDNFPSFLVRDRDATYGEIFRRQVEALNIQDGPTAPRSPSQNAYTERVIGSIQRRIRRIKGHFHHTHRHRNALQHMLHPEHAGNLPRIRCTAPKFFPQLPVFPAMAVLRPAATLSKPFLIATWVKLEDFAELAELAGLWRRTRIGDPYP